VLAAVVTDKDKGGRRGVTASLIGKVCVKYVDEVVCVRSPARERGAARRPFLMLMDGVSFALLH